MLRFQQLGNSGKVIVQFKVLKADEHQKKNLRGNGNDHNRYFQTKNLDSSMELRQPLNKIVAANEEKTRCW